MANLQERSATHSRVGPRIAVSRPRLVRSFHFAYEGLTWAWRTQPNFRIESSIGVVAFAAAVWLGVSPVPVLLCSMLVLSLELINTALEATVDLASPELQPLAKRAKDLSAAAVMVAALGSAVVGAWLLLPPLLGRLGLT